MAGFYSAVDNLRHIGVLGAMAPAVKGMRPLEFADSEEKKPSLIQRALNQAGLQSADPHGSRLCSFSESDDYLLFGDDDYLSMPPKVRTALLHKEHDDFAERMINEGRLPPGFKNGVIAFMDNLENEDLISFSDWGGQVTHDGARNWFKQFLSHMPQIIQFGEMDLGPAPDEMASNFDAPSGYKIDEDGQQTLREIEALAKRETLDFSEALTRYVNHKS